MCEELRFATLSIRLGYNVHLRTKEKAETTSPQIVLRLVVQAGRVDRGLTSSTVCVCISPLQTEQGGVNGKGSKTGSCIVNRADETKQVQ